MRDDPPRVDRAVREIVLNHEEARSWYPAGLTETPRGSADFVIITLESLTSAVERLADWEAAKGRTVEVVTTSWIDAQYAGTDLAEKTRNFLRDKYPFSAWGIEDVLLVGGYADVPIRRTWQDIGYGKPETDFYYAELSLPDHQSWDADPAFKKNILLLGAYFWNDTDCAELMEYKSDPALHPWMSDWTSTRMYEQNVDYWSAYASDYPLLHSNVLDVWRGGSFAFVDYAGHGSPWSSHIHGLGQPAFIESADCPGPGPRTTGRSPPFGST